MEVAQDYIERGYTICKVLKYSSIPRSTYYYEPTGGQPGRLPYAIIKNRQGIIVKDEHILEEIKTLFAKPFVDYGSYKTFRYLTDVKGYSIGKHKVYNLMRSNGLTRTRYQESSKRIKRNWVKDLIPIVSSPFHFFEFDIKYMWVQGKRKNIQVLTIVDVFSRMNLGQHIAYQIKSKDVIKLFQKIIEEYGLPSHFTVRCDNGSQFVALEVQHYLFKAGVTQEFTKPSTPQQNAHIESYHSIMERAVCQRIEFSDAKDVREKMTEFRDFYNFERIHSGVSYMSPFQYLLKNEEEFNLSNSFQQSFFLLKKKYIQFLKLSNN